MKEEITMPILEIEIVGDSTPDKNLASRIALSSGKILETKPGHTWVKVRTLPTDSYAENESCFNEVKPVFVSVLLANLPSEDERARLATRLTEAVSAETGRPKDNVHLFFQPEGAGRASFGGELLRKRPTVPTRSFSNAPWEKQVGYCRAIRSGNQIAVTGTVSVDDAGAPHGIDDAYAQAVGEFQGTIAVERQVFFFRPLSLGRVEVSDLPRRLGRFHCAG